MHGIKDTEHKRFPTPTLVSKSFIINNCLYLLELALVFKGQLTQFPIIKKKKSP